MLLTETASVVRNPRNKKHYIDLGYEFINNNLDKKIC